jgi:hypothetical protein
MIYGRIKNAMFPGGEVYSITILSFAFIHKSSRCIAIFTSGLMMTKAKWYYWFLLTEIYTKKCPIFSTRSQLTLSFETKPSSNHRSENNNNYSQTNKYNNFFLKK